MSRRINQSWWKGGRLIGRIDPKQVREKKKNKCECRQPGSNQRPSDLQSDALPTELYRRWLGGREGRTRQEEDQVKKCRGKRGHEGIEPSTSPTLKENHTTRPMAREHACLEWDSNPRLRRDSNLSRAPWTARPSKLGNRNRGLGQCLKGKRKKNAAKMEHRGFDPRTSCLQSTHSSD